MIVWLFWAQIPALRSHSTKCACDGGGYNILQARDVQRINLWVRQVLHCLFFVYAQKIFHDYFSYTTHFPQNIEPNRLQEYISSPPLAASRYVEIPKPSVDTTDNLPVIVGCVSAAAVVPRKGAARLKQCQHCLRETSRFSKLYPYHSRQRAFVQ